MISPLAILAEQERPDDIDALRADRERLNRLIAWFSFNDTFEGSGVRDWTDAEDARVAIDEAVML